MSIFRTGKTRKVRSIKSVLTFSISIFTSAVIIVIVAINLCITTNNLMENIGHNDIKTVNEISNNIDTALKKVEIVSRIINSDRQINNTIQLINSASANKGGNTSNYYNWKSKIDQPVTNIMDIVGDIHSAGIYSKNGYDFYFGALSENQINSEDQIYINKLFSQLSNYQFTWNSDYDLAGDHVFSLTRKMVDATNMETIGYLILNVDDSYLTNILNMADLIDSSGIFLSDRNNTIIASNEWCKKMDRAEISTVLHCVNSGGGYFISNIKHTKFLVAYSTSAYTGWKTVALLPLNKQKTDLIRNQILLLAIGACGILLSVFLSETLASRILRPIEKLQATMKIAEQGYSVNYRDDTFLETMTLGCSFVKMLKALRVMTKKAYEGELRKQKAEFKALQAQINPHFLYNTLETIDCMLLVKGQFEISKIVVYLGDILRYSVDRDINRVTLKEDMENVIKYLHIQELRFGDRIRFDVDITKEAMQCEVLKLLIQPVVENGILHGLAEKRKNGFLRISGLVRKSELLITVSDNGIGMDQGQLEQIMRSHSAVSMHSHIGLSNVNQRIKLCYGEKYGVSVSSQKGKGTVVNMVLPAIKMEGKDNENPCCR